MSDKMKKLFFLLCLFPSIVFAEGEIIDFLFPEDDGATSLEIRRTCFDHGTKSLIIEYYRRSPTEIIPKNGKVRRSMNYADIENEKPYTDVFELPAGAGKKSGQEQLKQAWQVLKKDALKNPGNNGSLRNK
jgi:hypothetical protein